MRCLGVAVLLWVLAGPVWAQQACGPVVRGLGGDYFLVQCNGVIMQVNDEVSIRRGGQEVARGKVKRAEGNLCSVQAPAGAVQRMDVVYLLSGDGDAARGPAIPVAQPGRSGGLAPATSSASAPASAKSKRDTFFSGVGSGGRVLNLNTGEMVTEK